MNRGNKGLTVSISFVEKALDEYKDIYRRNSYRIDINRVWLISLQMRVLLTMLILEACLQSDLVLDAYTYKFNFKYYTFRHYITHSLVPEYTLEQILLICNLANISLTQVKQRVIGDILKNLGEQKDKETYEKFNKLYSNN